MQTVVSLAEGEDDESVEGVSTKGYDDSVLEEGELEEGIFEEEEDEEEEEECKGSKESEITETDFPVQQPDLKVPIEVERQPGEMLRYAILRRYVTCNTSCIGRSYYGLLIVLLLIVYCQIIGHPPKESFS